jgi:hypothetical protein
VTPPEDDVRDFLSLKLFMGLHSTGSDRGYLRDLSDAQRQAVTHPPCSLQILAGPGSVRKDLTQIACLVELTRVILRSKTNRARLVCSPLE